MEYTEEDVRAAMRELAFKVCWGWTDEEKLSRMDLYMQWVRSRPPRVREVAEKFPPGIYWYDEPEQVVELFSFDEPEDENDPITVKVLVKQCYNPHKILCMERTVFGIDPNKLEPIDTLFDANAGPPS